MRRVLSLTAHGRNRNDLPLAPSFPSVPMMVPTIVLVNAVVFTVVVIVGVVGGGGGGGGDVCAADDDVGAESDDDVGVFCEFVATPAIVSCSTI